MNADGTLVIRLWKIWGFSRVFKKFSKENPVCILWIDSTLWNMCNILMRITYNYEKKGKKRKKYPVYNFLEHVPQSEIFWKIIKHSITNYWNKLNVSRNEA